MKTSAFESQEYYKWDYPTLVEQLGMKKAQQKVAMYQTAPWVNIPCVKNGRLLQSYKSSGILPSLPEMPFVPAPQLTEAEYTDITDKGISIPYPEKHKKWQQKQKAAKRAKQYV